MRVYIKRDDVKETVCVSDAEITLITDPRGGPLALISDVDGATMVHTVKDGEREFFEAIERAGFKIEPSDRKGNRNGG